ncbi:flavin mononucleotide reductase [Neoasaia chiangmaiensis NBRC 101099]|nr:flavin reductase [Neoasaia chiangmaiensis]GBR41891.1 flavin mononucleotide reductase [Neoasaia chiangmaiensis NBRC 101099]GEN14257.1 FMN reductase (NADH) RutF [Neoasaia chiangmaiensis]
MTPNSSNPAPATKAAFRDAMSLLGAPVVVVTTDGPAGRHGLTVSAICSVSDTPPTVLVCLNRTNRSHEAFLANRTIGISILAAHHDDIASAFAGGTPGTDRFDHGVWRPAPHGAPLLEGALIGLDCTLDVIQSSGSHDVLFCRVENIFQHPDRTESRASGPLHALAWFARRFHMLPLAHPASKTDTK